MTDTNWCTFCDCAIDPSSDFIYCSEECFKRDAPDNQYFTSTVNGQKHDNQLQIKTIVSAQSSIDPIMMSPPQFDHSRRGSCSSVSSEDLAAMYFDTLPSTPPNNLTLELHPLSPATVISSIKTVSFTPPLLSTSISSPNSHEGILGTPTGCSYNLSLPEKQNPALLISNIFLSHPKF